MPVRIFGFGSPLTAVVRKMRSPQTTGQEWPRPGIGVFQRTLVPAFTSQVTGGFCPSATPVAFGPRNDGQFSGAATVPEPSSFGATVGFGSGLSATLKRLISDVNRFM